MRAASSHVSAPNMQMLRRRFYPHGRALQIETNEPRVLLVAQDLWGRYERLAESPAVRLRITVAADVTAAALRRDYLNDRYTFCSANGCATADLRSGNAEARITPDCAASLDALRYEYLEPLGYSLVAARHFTLLHAAAVALDGGAVLLCGSPGAGKTCLAYAAARRGWSFLSGDATALERDEPRLRIVGRPFELRFRHSAVALFPELAEFNRTFGPEGKPNILVDADRLPIHIEVQAPPVGIVFLDRWDLERATVEMIDAADARKRLGESVFYGGADLRARQRRALERLLVLPLARMRYTSLDTAVDALDHFLRCRGSGA